jgi:hypothetical protein
VTACVVGLVLLVLTPVFEKLPLNVMGAIVVSGVSGLFEYEQAVHLFKVRRLVRCMILHDIKQSSGCNCRWFCADGRLDSFNRDVCAGAN